MKKVLLLLCILLPGFAFAQRSDSVSSTTKEKILPLQSEVKFSFKEGDITKVVVLDILMSNPLKASVCSVE